MGGSVSCFDSAQLRAQQVEQISRQGIDGRVFQGNGGRQRLLQAPFQLTAHFQRHQRIHAQIGKTGGNAKGLIGRLTQAKDLPNHGAQIAAQMARALTGGQGEQFLDHRGGGRSGGFSRRLGRSR